MNNSLVNFVRIYEKWWLVLSALLIIVIITGGILFGLRQWDRGGSIEIIPASTEVSTLDVYITGAIANEGIYNVREENSLRDILQRAGYITGEDEITNIEIHIPVTSEDSILQPQKININTAEAWLLEALPGIGSTLSQRIIEYRENESLFNSVEELTEVNGIGTVTLDNIRDRICVLD